MDINNLTLEETKLLAIPSSYAVLRCGYNVYPWQQKTLDALLLDDSYVGLRTCNESGKTSIVIAAFILWHMENFPWSKIITTSASNLQIREQLYPVLRAIAGNWPGWSIQTPKGQACIVSCPNGSRCISYATDDAKLAEGFHTPDPQNYMEDWTPPRDWKFSEMDEEFLVDGSSLAVVVDEAKGIKSDIFEAITRCNANRHLYASSPDPDDQSSDFYRMFHDDAEMFRNPQGTLDLYNCSYTDCPHIMENKVKKRRMEQQIKLRGEDNPFVMSWCFGEFSTGGGGSLFEIPKVNLAMSGSIGQIGVSENPRRAGLDLSAGGDATVLTVGEGNTYWIEKIYYEKDSYKLAKMLMADFLRLGLRAELINSDNGHVGHAINSHFQS